MNFLKKHFDFAIIALVIGGFVYVAGARLATAPLPDTDESMMLQISYEMLYHGKLAFPMKRFYGGNIENAWHSLTPVAFVTLSGFLKAFGWGLVQGRAYNLVTAVFVILILYLLARRLFSWRVGLTAVLLMISDPLFIARSRLLRYDLIAAGFALLAYYLFEKGEDREVRWWYLASGVAAGAGVMSHTNVLYILAVIPALMLLEDRWRLFTESKLYLFVAGSLAAMAYEIVFAIVDYRNFMLQTRKDDVHFRVLEPMGWLNNLTTEPGRYLQWFEARGARIASETLLLHLFLSLTVVAIGYLIVYGFIQARRGTAITEPRVRVLIATLIIVIFFAVVTQRKVTQYVVHLAPWFALCVAILLRDAATGLLNIRRWRWRMARQAYGVALVVIALFVSAYGYELLKQNRNYLTNIRNPDQASFDELKTALNRIVPEGVCPASIASGYLWLAFPERDDCYFAYMEASLDEPLELEGKEYALIAKPKFESRVKKLTGAGFEKFHLLGEVNGTAYGSLSIYYTGDDPRIKSLAPKRYYFFGRSSGCVGDEQLAASREVWAADSSELSWKPALTSRSVEPDDSDEDLQDKGDRKGKWMEICSAKLDAHSIYQVVADTNDSPRLDLAIIDNHNVYPIQRIVEANERRVNGVFKTSGSRSVTLAARVSGARGGESSSIMHISIRAIR